MFVAAAKPVHRDLARIMRADGASVRRIAEALRVSQASVSVWVRDVEQTPEQRRALRDLTQRQRVGHGRRSQTARELRAAAQQRGRELARSESALHRAGCMLFWAEGSRNRNSVRFTNADVAMHAYFLRFLRECYAVSDDRVVLSVNCFLGNGLSVTDIETWWLRRLELPSSCLRPTIVNRPSRASKGVHRTLLHGTARLSVHSTEIAQSIYGAIQEYTGVDRPEWLDLDYPSQPIRRPEVA
jgi:predicted transcriptional regulator